MTGTVAGNLILDLNDHARSFYLNRDGTGLDGDRRAFYQYQSALMEPWDGPAVIAATDGHVIGATLDRNGLRPARYSITKDGLVIMASEEGVLDVPPEDIVTRWRLRPGRMLMVDTLQGRILNDEEATLDGGLFVSGAEGARTPDLRAASATLSQLSYSPSVAEE